MKKSLLIPVLVLSVGATLFAKETMKKETIKPDIKKESYAIGASTGNYVLNQIIRQDKLGVKTNINEVVKGFQEALLGKLQMNDDEIITYLNLRADNLNKLKREKIAKIKRDNLEKSKKYLAKNRTKKGVIETKSGLQYEVLKKGNGKEVRPESIVVINYKAKLTDGTVFDDTYKRKAPAHLSMINVIDGLKEGLMLMKEGAKYRLTIPSKLAYGEEGLNNIPPNSAVIFEVELLKVMSPNEFQKMMHKSANVKIEKKDSKDKKKVNKKKVDKK